MFEVGLVAFLVGAMVGLLGRPFLDAYLYWKSAQLFRHDTDESEPHHVGPHR